ncbi:MAG: 2-succinyl-5-enolpyruvyl-6-hydroxy-3-cyclohexene-1-carboxylic-acid synthase [Actinomycetota bacterium]|nr:2-succinyl-5-enolpyruvyl-6-hydroxy-3-cyclohexene-1-carboxylic-acid synthase [Actinomycetota bacterium]
MQQSVPTTSVVQATFVATLVDEWTRLGLRDVVICPGSRSTPVALAFSRRSEIALHVRIDERSAAFFALGRALVTSRPVALVVTSGTAAAEVHAAVAEADLAHVSLLVVTADRPPELHGVGAPQTIDQQHLYGAKVRLYEEPGVARLDAASSWRPLARRLYAGADGGTGLPGPVHLNAAFVEPLVADALELAPASTALTPPRHAAWSAADIDVSGQRVLCVIGAGTRETLRRRILEQAKSVNWVVVGDATANETVAYADPLVRHDLAWAALSPDVVIRIGGVPASKFLAQRLATSGVEVIALDGGGPVADPDAVVTQWVSGLPDAQCPSHHADEKYVAQWRAASEAIDHHLSDFWGDELDEVLVAREVVEIANRHSTALVVGSSMPVRDVEWWSVSRSTPVYSNRGANGIDGVVSTFLGVAEGSSAIALVGDVTMLHDVSALVDGCGVSTRAVLVVNDNGGGGIFSFLSQARQVPHEQFESLFGTPRHHDLAVVARAFGHHGEVVTTTAQLRDSLAAALRRDGLSVVVARVPSRESNVARHEELNTLVGRWWSAR